MAKTSIHVRPVLASSEEHNQRLKPLDYVKQELTHQNTSLVKASVSDTLKDVKSRYEKTTGQKMQKKATPIREAVVVLDKKTSMRDMEKLSEKFQERFGLRTFQIHIHEDEGHTDKHGDFLKNRHAHMVIDWTDSSTGKSLKLTKDDMSEMQTLTADTLGMERGQSSDKKHLTAIQFKNEAQKQEFREVEKRTKEAKLDLQMTKAANLAANTGEKLKNGLFEGIKRITGHDKAANAVENAQIEIENLKKQLAEKEKENSRYADVIRKQHGDLKQKEERELHLIKRNTALESKMRQYEGQQNQRNKGMSI